MTKPVYIEFAAKDLSASKAFFKRVFKWKFEDYGPAYTAFFASNFEGGFYEAPLSSSVKTGGALLVLYAEDLPACLAEVQAAGGQISQEIFVFPGGARFHFIEPSGNELAVWSEKAAPEAS